MGYENKTKPQLLRELKAAQQKINELIETKDKVVSEVQNVKQTCEFYENIRNTIDDPLFIKDEQHKWVYLNEAACKFWGHAKEELIGKSDYDIFQKEQAEIYWKRDDIVLRTGKTDQNEEPQTIDGTLQTISTKKSIYVDAQSSKKYIVGIIWDITKTKKREQELRESREFMRKVIDASPAHIFVKDREGTYLLVNKKLVEFYGTDYEALEGKREIDLAENTKMRIKDFKKFLEDDKQIIDSQQPMFIPEEPATLPDGTTKWLQTVKIPLSLKSNPDCVLGVSIDITDRKLSEDALREERDRTQKYLDIAGVMFIAFNAKGDVTLTNRKGSEILGYERGEIIGKNWFDSFLPVRVKDQTRTVYNRLVAGEIEPVEYYENPILTKGGEERIIAWHNTILQDDEGNCIGTLSSGEDITERKQAEVKLRTEKEFTDTALDVQLDTFFLFEPTTSKAIRWNRAFRKISGYTDEEIARMPAPASYYSPEDLKRAAAFIQKVLVEGTGTIEMELICKDGSRVPTEYRVSVINDEQGEPKYMISIGRDITERKRAEEEKEFLKEQLAQAQKMEAIGRLAGGIAHDFNNLLTTILGYSEMVMTQQELSETTADNIAEIRNSAERATSLVDQLLTFSRKQILQPRAIDVNKLIASIRKMLKRLIGEDIDLKTKYGPDACFINADRGQIEQVIMNLVVNARDAMPDGGNITIETSCVDCSEDSSTRYPEMPPGQYVRLIIHDTGHGMDEDTKKSIFEPFFTTKKEGTGLGLSTVYGIVKQSGGHIAVESELGKGTTFTIYIPKIDGTEEQPVERVHASSLRNGSESVLVVEDEVSVRRMICKVLKKYNYTVYEAESVQDAFDIIDQNTDRQIDLLVTDVMPDMNGRELSERILEKRPEIKVLYISGYTDDAIAQHGVLDETMNFLQKPFTPSAFAQKVREVLDRD